MPLTIPTLLTWLRMLAIPVLVVIYLLPVEGISLPLRNVVGTVVFVAAAITDWLDGWLARRLGQVSAFGAFLDPVADKLLVCTALVLLLALQRMDPLVAVIIVGREITISSLREWMALMGTPRSVAVSSLGKLKTVSQLLAIPLLLYHQPLWGVVPVQQIGTVLMYLAAALTLWSMVYYLKQAWPHLRDVS
jgi:CDP-diacylglycerol--glycerol-3-phosphate 3-phosphatidyltransferase